MKSLNLILGCALAALPTFAFEKIALVDSYDFARTYDVESATGNVQVLEHVLRTGADTVLWRNCSGGLVRYHSEEEAHPFCENPLNKLRIPASRAVFGWLRLETASPDIFRSAMENCRARGVAHGVHMPYEETHGASWTLGTWNLEHPQFWGVTRRGVPFYGRTSLAYPEVLEHRLRLLDELLERGADVVYIDLMRTGGWSPAMEYVPEMRRRWHERFGDETPLLANSHDERWLELVGECQNAFFEAVRARLNATGRKVRLILGIDRVCRKSGEFNWTERAVDWRRLARMKVVDGISVMSVDVSAIDLKDPWASTRASYETVREQAAGVPVYFPIMAYNFSGRPGFPEYAKWTGLSEARVVRRLLELARDAGGAGITMEVVDYRNYSDAVCAEIARFGAKLTRGGGEW